MSRPVQIKIAESEMQKSDERKLFVGMLSQETNEDYLRQLFTQFGTIEDVAILRNPDGSNKGCGFVKFTDHHSAQNAINALHNRITLSVRPSLSILALSVTFWSVLSFCHLSYPCRVGVPLSPHRSIC
jgi:RNA recognition motif-containing protein